MSEYWKSVPRKFCDFCKCWITDNKPSVDFHERGKRHQENVKKKIDDVKKKSLEKAKKEEEMDSDIRKMEKAALEAFRKDLADNPELAAGYAAKLKAVREKEESKEKKSKPLEEETTEEKVTNDDLVSADQNVREWYEAKSPEGYTYYWSCVTGASVWEPPANYISLSEQEMTTTQQVSSADSKTLESKDHKENLPDTAPIPDAIPIPDASPIPDKAPIPDTILSVSDIPLPSETVPAPVVTDTKPKEPEKPREDPRWARASYGSWEAVTEEEPEYVDLELPEPAHAPENNEIPFPDLEPSEPKVKFKEKKVVSLGNKDSAPVAFKKRKLGASVRSMRKRDDEDV